MNDQDRVRLNTLSGLLGRIPFPHDGVSTHTASIDGAFSFSRDMRVVKYLLVKFLNGAVLLGCDGLEMGWDYTHPDDTLDLLEQYVSERGATGWATDGEWSYTKVHRLLTEKDAARIEESEE